MLVLLEVLGFAGVTFGVWGLSHPVGIIVGGVLLVVLAQLLDGLSLPKIPWLRRGDEK